MEQDSLPHGPYDPLDALTENSSKGATSNSHPLNPTGAVQQLMFEYRKKTFLHPVLLRGDNPQTNISTQMLNQPPSFLLGTSHLYKKTIKKKKKEKRKRNQTQPTAPHFHPVHSSPSSTRANPSPSLHLPTPSSASQILSNDINYPTSTGPVPMPAAGAQRKEERKAGPFWHG
ncbi:hypothetical protein BDBG_17391 [Blastomyces gilchristii SLH14081]|uniref:Uncharacterized protein n=1 Tax=Blastomyces gilchristii (strain SLH14081) TaxID=559298 RepID=A0A179UTQ2_BLAGS|nr:uncharacterized protein BDBG_17391 [Blastomyces gilchristii SLH14081]OAT10619.1 hypothetical protein BDBG_17391 [Blastomyces gilchristii SLH14081]